MGTFSTGINIRNLHNIIFASPSKSQIRVLQSIGRSLRKSDDGREAKLYDIADDLHWLGRKKLCIRNIQPSALKSIINRNLIIKYMRLN